MILVDTSALVSFLTGRETDVSRYLERLVEDSAVFYLPPAVIQETLQGARDRREWRRLEAYLTTQLVADVVDPVASRVGAARIYFDCRRKGLTVRSAADCLIAQIALERDFSLLHDDRDFEAISRVRPLKTVP